MADSETRQPEQHWTFDPPSYLIGMAFMFALWIIILPFAKPSPKTLTDAEIISQTNICNSEGRTSAAFNDADGHITKIWCGLPPFKDTSGAQWGIK